MNGSLGQFGWGRRRMDGIGGLAQRKAKGKGRKVLRRRAKCKTVTFKRAKRGGKMLPRSQWTTVERCEGRSAKGKWRRAAKSRRQCRRGGKGPKAHLYAKCPRRRRAA